MVALNGAAQLTLDAPENAALSRELNGREKLSLIAMSRLLIPGKQMGFAIPARSPHFPGLPVVAPGLFETSDSIVAGL